MFQKRFSNRHILSLLPCVRCYPPLEVLNSGQRGLAEECLGMDKLEFQSEVFQRPYQYLLRYENRTDLDLFSYSTPEGLSLKSIISENSFPGFVFVRWSMKMALVIFHLYNICRTACVLRYCFHLARVSIW